MAQQDPAIFSMRAMEKLRSPDDLDKYVRVTNPSAWAVLLACLFLLAGLLTWGFLGTVSTSVTGMGVVTDGQAMSFLPADDVARLHEGDAALVGGQKMKVSHIGDIPLSRDEVSRMLESDYLVETLVEGSWATLVTFKGDASTLAEGVPLTVNIVTEHVAPITLILGA